MHYLAYGTKQHLLPYLFIFAWNLSLIHIYPMDQTVAVAVDALVQRVFPFSLRMRQLLI